VRVTTHTPGPWLAEADPSGIVRVYGGGALEYVCAVDSALGGAPDRRKNELNAYLVVQAPRLEAALEAVVDMLTLALARNEEIPVARVLTIVSAVLAEVERGPIGGRGGGAPESSG
jgi:hypothetical protein